MMNYKRQFKTEAEEAEELYGKPMSPLEACEYNYAIAEREIKNFKSGKLKSERLFTVIALILSPFIFIGIFTAAERYPSFLRIYIAILIAAGAYKLFRPAIEKRFPRSANVLKQVLDWTGALVIFLIAMVYILSILGVYTFSIYEWLFK